MKIDFLHQAEASKVTAAETILRRAGLRWEQVCFMGDDVVDMGALRRAGVAVAVANAIDEVKELAHYVTTRQGGDGAVREVATWILKSQGTWAPLLRHFSE